MSFLYENYNDDAWYWELVEVIRKLVLTCGIILIGRESRAYVGLASICSGLFAIVYAFRKPIKDEFEDKLQLTSLLVIFLNLGIGVILKIPKESVPSMLWINMSIHCWWTFSLLEQTFWLFCLLWVCWISVKLYKLALSTLAHHFIQGFFLFVRCSFFVFAFVCCFCVCFSFLSSFKCIRPYSHSPFYWLVELRTKTSSLTIKCLLSCFQQVAILLYCYTTLWCGAKTRSVPQPAASPCFYPWMTWVVAWIQ